MSADLQKSAGGHSASHSDQSDGRIAFPPFSGKLGVDEGLKLSCENFKEFIDDFFKDKNITPLSQLTATPPFPTPHVLAQFSSKAYTGYITGEIDAQYEARLALPDGWKLLTTASNCRWNNGYFGVACWHPEHQQVVIAHRGTDPTNLGALWADLNGVLLNHYVRQMESASTFALKVVNVLREVNRSKRVEFQVFFTGHSLGGWLAQVTTFTTEYLKREENLFLKSYNDNDCYHPHTVVFDSPGCKDMLSQMRDTFDVRLDGRFIDIEHLDISSYLSAPNHINTCNTHIGTVYRVFTDLSDMGKKEKHTALYNLATHNIDKIVQAFDPETGQVHKDEQGQLKVQVGIDWPVSTGLTGGEEYKKFFKWANHLNNYHPDTKDVSFQHLHYYPIRYQTKLYDGRVNSLNIFSEEEQEFLQCYSWLRQWPEFFNLKELFSELKDNQAQEDAEKILQTFEIEKDTIRSTDGNALQGLIPYVKRLLQLFPRIKEKTKHALSTNDVRKRVYQFETRSYVERIRQNLLEFNSKTSTFTEFLESEQQRVLHLRMVKCDEWTGLIKVYKVLQKTGCLIEGQYSILKLERLLKLNQLMDLSKLMQSTVTSHLLLIACEDNQQMDEETKDVIRTLVDTIKQKSNIKIIFITRSGGSIVAFLHHMGRRISGEGFVRRTEEVEWCDLTSSSQEKLLEKSVKFQGYLVSLKELITAKSPVTKFLPLGALMDKKELKMADPVPIANTYNEGYYIGRIFRHQKDIKQDIFSDESVRDSRVYLARTEQEFKQLCQKYPKSNVHWLEDKSGKLVWQKSKGSLETLRRYIDTESSHTCTDGNLDKLLEQAQHQRVMLISDTAGMGKSTVLTHLSQRIKQKFPTKWVLRIDLNDHTNALNELKQEQIDKVKAIEFVSTKLLELKPGIEMELFKKCCDQKQKLRIVVMLDGFDEISPSYKETVIDLLQALMQTEVEHLWVTTRPHLKEELEDKLHQLTYTLEPFSEKDQVEFLTKFWSLQDWFTETKENGKEIQKNNLEVYAKRLIKILTESIRDIEREFTGIPLQTRMLAEAFDQEVNAFCQSSELLSDLPFKLDLIGLYGRFIERKYDIYQEEKFRVNVNNVAAIGQRKRELKSLREDHQQLALKVLFTEEQMALFQNRERSFSTEDLTRIGIVQVSHDGKPHFIHRTFAEYYVADCLVNRLTEGNNISDEELTFILKDVFLQNDYRVIRVFMDGLLSNSKPSHEVLKQRGNRINALGLYYGEQLLDQAVSECNVYIVAILSDSLQAAEHTETFIRLLLAEDYARRSRWNLAIWGGNLQVIEKLWECANVKLKTEDKNNMLLLAKNLEGRTVFHTAAKQGRLEVLQKLWEWANEKLTKEEINNNLLLATDKWKRTVFHMAADQGRLEILQKIWEWAIEKLTTEEINNNLLLATDDERRTVFHMAAWRERLDIIQKVWEWSNETLTREAINKNLLLATDNEGRTVFHMAADKGRLETLQKVWELANETLTTEEVNKNLLLASDTWRRTVFHMAADQGRLELLQKFWEWANKTLTMEEINNKLLLATDIEERTVFNMAANKGRLDILEKLWEWANVKLTTEKINNELLLAKGYMGRTVFHMAAEWGRLELLQKVWEWANEKLTIEEISNKLLLATDDKGRTVFHMAADKGRLELLQKVWEWAKKILPKKEINILLLATDDEGRTAFYMAASKGRSEILEKMWEWANEKVTKEEINKKLLLAIDEEGKNIFQMAANKGRLEILQKLWEWANEKLTTEEINNNFLLAKDKWRRTVFHMATNKYRLEILQSVWQWATEKLTTEDINNKLLLATDDEGRTVFYMAGEQGELETFQKVWEWANENLTTEKINNEILLAKDCMGRTLFHMATERGRLELLHRLWEWANQKPTAEEIINKILLSKDNEERTVFHVAANKGRIEILEKVWELANWKLTTEKVNNELLLAKCKGRTVFHMAAEWGRLELLQKIWEWANENLTTEEINNNLLLATDEVGRTVLHMAVKRGKSEILEKIWEWSIEKLTTEEINKNLLLATDKWRRTVFHMAADQGRLKILQKIWVWAKEKFTAEEINKKLLLDTDDEGRAIFYMAAEQGEL